VIHCSNPFFISVYTIEQEDQILAFLDTKRKAIEQHRGLRDSSKPLTGYDGKTVAQDIHQLVSQLGFKTLFVGYERFGWVRLRLFLRWTTGRLAIATKKHNGLLARKFHYWTTCLPSVLIKCSFETTALPTSVDIASENHDCTTIYFPFAFFLLERYSLHASITTAVDVVSLSSAYCFNCLMRVFGNNHVVLTFTCSILVTAYTKSLLG